MIKTEEIHKIANTFPRFSKHPIMIGGNKLQNFGIKYIGQ